MIPAGTKSNSESLEVIKDQELHLFVVLCVNALRHPNRFSTDEGQCWHVYNFTTEPIFFTGLASEPGARSMNVSLWGYRDSFISQNWISFTIDFRELLTRDCEPLFMKRFYFRSFMGELSQTNMLF